MKTIGRPIVRASRRSAARSATFWPEVNLSNFKVDPEALRLLPPDIAVEQTMLPLRHDGDTLILAIADPNNLEVIGQVKPLTHLSIIPVRAPESILRRKIVECYQLAEIPLPTPVKLSDVSKVMDALGVLAEDDPSAVRFKSESSLGSGSSWTVRVPRPPKGKVVIAVADDHNITIRTLESSSVGAREIGTRLAEIEAVLDEFKPLLHEAPGSTPSLTAVEEEILARGGLKPEDLHYDVSDDPVVQTAAEYSRLLRESYSTAEAAALLGVNTSRIRQRLSRDRTLYGIRLGKEWRIPKFQFSGKTLITGLDDVFPELPQDLHPIAVHTWFTTPHVDLRSDDEELSLTPLDWLRTGRSATTVAELAADL